MNEKKLLYWNQLGLIPGPEEEESAFLARVEYCLSLREHLRDRLSEKLPFDVGEQGSGEILVEPFNVTQKLFDIAPDWIPVYFSDYQLSFWHGGCAWIFKADEKTPTGALFQLRQVFRKKTKIWGLYDRDELIAHELAHVGRMEFKEPKFEEFHAYQTARTAFRRWFGPIVQSAKESLFFVLLLLLVVIVDLSYPIWWVRVLPAAAIGAALIRLFWRHRQYSRCYNNLSACFTNPDAVIYRLTDDEIIRFGKGPISSRDSLRWKVIKMAYGHPDYLRILPGTG